jgi:hypothetical protein
MGRRKALHSSARRRITHGQQLKGQTWVTLANLKDQRRFPADNASRSVQTRRKPGKSLVLIPVQWLGVRLIASARGKPMSDQFPLKPDEVVKALCTTNHSCR